MKLSCEVIQDLIPLVNDGVASAESKQLVQEHCLQCPTCNTYINNSETLDIDRLNKKWKKKIRWSMLGFMTLFVLLACSFTTTQLMFQNFLFLPFIGMIGYILLQKKVFLLYLLILITHSILELFNPKMGLSIIIFIAIYWFLLTIGIIIYRLFYFAFKGGSL